MKIYIYSKCSTCKKAMEFLKTRVKPSSVDVKEITDTPPTIEELKTMLKHVGGDIKKLFNTSGILYREMRMSDKLKAMSEKEALSLLHSNGMLVKRPFLLGKDFGLVGYREKAWDEKLKGKS